MSVLPGRGVRYVMECGTSAPLSAAEGDFGGKLGGYPPKVKAELTFRTPKIGGVRRRQLVLSTIRTNEDPLQN